MNMPQHNQPNNTSRNVAVFLLTIAISISFYIGGIITGFGVFEVIHSAERITKSDTQKQDSPKEADPQKKYDEGFEDPNQQEDNRDSKKELDEGDVLEKWRG